MLMNAKHSLEFQTEIVMPARAVLVLLEVQMFKHLVVPQSTQWNLEVPQAAQNANSNSVLNVIFITICAVMYGNLR